MRQVVAGLLVLRVDAQCRLELFHGLIELSLRGQRGAEKIVCVCVVGFVL